MVYNVENLFDDVADGSEYREFNPQRGGWSSELFAMRVDTIAEVVRKALPGGPDILAVQEVENQRALEALRSALRDLRYAHLALVPKKGSATNTGILSRLPIVKVHSLAVPRWKRDTVRDVVEAEIVAGGRTLHLLNNHWKSKTEGPRETEESRIQASRVVSRRLREILSEDPLADIIVVGDLNENTDEYRRAGRKYQTALIPFGEKVPPAYSVSSIFLTAVPAEAGLRDGRLVLYDPWFEVGAAERGSYMYRRQWQTLDHVLLSPGLFDGGGFSYRPGGFRVLRSPFLLTAKGAPRKWDGLKGKRGFSDHLPLILRLNTAD
jgi:endonuclease/exonuclease/phosphatase family metal-dependent hydrolase